MGPVLILESGLPANRGQKKLKIVDIFNEGLSGTFRADEVSSRATPKMDDSHKDMFGLSAY